MQYLCYFSNSIRKPGQLKDHFSDMPGHSTLGWFGLNHRRCGRCKTSACYSRWQAVCWIASPARKHNSDVDATWVRYHWAAPQTLLSVISIPISAACMPSLMRMVSGWVQQTPAVTVLSNTPSLELTGIFGYFFRFIFIFSVWPKSPNLLVRRASRRVFLSTELHAEIVRLTLVFGQSLVH